MTAFIFLANQAASSGSDEGLDTIFLLLASSGFTAIIVSVITAIVNRRKLKAEEVNIISQAAGGVVTRLEEENIRVIGERDKARDRCADLELAAEKRQTQIEGLKDQIDAHLEYDKVLVAQLKAAGIDADEPPPIIIPR